MAERKSLSNGFIKLHRAIFDSPEFKGGEMTDREAFIWMICQCAWVAKEYRYKSLFIELKRGEFAASIREMADTFSWKKSRVERWIKRLKDRDTIGTRTETANGTRLTIIKVKGYKAFQDKQKPDRDTNQAVSYTHLTLPTTPYV